MILDRLLRAADGVRHRARLRLWPADQATGRLGEDLAHRYLRRQGYTIVARNYRPRSGYGEIDLVAWDGATLAFVEVKTRASDDFGAPDRNVDIEKERAVHRVARDYARRANIEWNHVRFDLVQVVLASPPRLTLQKSAFPNRQVII